MNCISKLEKQLVLLRTRLQEAELVFEENAYQGRIEFSFRVWGYSGKNVALHVFMDSATGGFSYIDQGERIDDRGNSLYTIVLKKKCVIDRAEQYYIITVDNERYFFTGAGLDDLLASLYDRLGYHVVRTNSYLKEPL